MKLSNPCLGSSHQVSTKSQMIRVDEQLSIASPLFSNYAHQIRKTSPTDKSLNVHSDHGDRGNQLFFSRSDFQHGQRIQLESSRDSNSLQREHFLKFDINYIL